MIGMALAAAATAASSIYGGIKASQSAKEQAASIRKQKAKNQNWYDRRYNEDATQRADAQAILTRTEESIKQRNRAAAGSAAVMGGTDESVAATKAANNQALADATSQIAANAESRKDNIEATYLQNDNAFATQQQEAEAKKQEAITGAVQGVAEAAGEYANSFGAEDSKSDETKPKL